MNIETKADFARVLCRYLAPGATMRMAEELADAYASTVQYALSTNGDVVRLPGLGTLKCIQAPSREASHPATKEPITIAARRRVKFTPAKTIKQLVNGGKGK